jgi:hypothetical protein
MRVRMEPWRRTWPAELPEEAASALLREYDALSFEFERQGGYDLEFERNR